MNLSVRNGVDGCHRSSATRIRACVCRSRDELETRVESALLDCVRHSPVAQLYAAINRIGAGGGPTTPAAAGPEQLVPQAAAAKEKEIETAKKGVCYNLIELNSSEWIPRSLRLD